MTHLTRSRTCPIDGSGLAPGAVICPGCARRTQILLREINAPADLLRELDVTISRQSVMRPDGDSEQCPDGCTHAADDPGCVAGVRVDVDTRASDARRALVDVLARWAARWAAETTIRATHAPTVAALMSSPRGHASLLARIRDLPGRAWAADMAAEVAAAVDAAWRAVDRPPDVKVVGRCGCGAALYATEHVSGARCRHCGTVTVVADARRAALAESSELLPASDLAAALHVPGGTVKSWVGRGALVRVRYDLSGRPLYRVSDGAVLARRDPQPA